MKQLVIAIFTIVILGSGPRLSSQTTYTWTGAVSSSFSAAGNWSPVRQVGLSTDILVFNSGTSVNVSNVNQVTVGQLLVMNNTQLKLSPSTGNPKVLSILGNGGDNPGGENGQELADLKYSEYTVEDTTNLASQKYFEYMNDSSARENDIATLKYNEYKSPSLNGMGDIKKMEGEGDSSSDEDLMVGQGCSLTISANDPKLTIFLKQNATAAIQGKLVFTGDAAGSINSFDTHAITFKEGSELVQSCPGNIFTTEGINNAVYFENGSSLTINHPSAMDPFGTALPSSKVSFAERSTINFSLSTTGSINISGRSMPNIVIKPNAHINFSMPDNVTTDVSVSDISVNNAGKLSILCATSSPANLNVKGNLTVDGEFRIPNNKVNRCNLNFNGTAAQFISGNGTIDITRTIKQINISNDITLNRDLTVYSQVAHTRGNINTNGYTLKIFNQYISRAMLFVGIIIMPEGGDNPETESQEGDNLNTGNGSPNGSVPASFSISQNYPNPFNPTTKINYSVPKPSSVRITVYDLSGKEVASLVNDRKESSFYTAEFDGSAYASGVYFYRIDASAGGESYTKTLKMILTK